MKKVLIGMGVVAIALFVMVKAGAITSHEEHEVQGTGTYFNVDGSMVEY